MQKALQLASLEELGPAQLTAGSPCGCEWDQGRADAVILAESVLVVNADRNLWGKSQGCDALGLLICLLTSPFPLPRSRLHPRVAQTLHARLVRVRNCAWWCS